MVYMEKKSGQPTGKVLVLRNDNRCFLAVIRSLGRQKLCVHVGWFPSDCAAVQSKYVAKAHDIPPYSADDDSWKDTLISILRQEEFDLFTVDIMMPRMDGYELTRNLRGLPQYTKTPILMVTSKSEKIDKMRGLDAGADEYMTKPVDKVNLVRTITKLLE